MDIQLQPLTQAAFKDFGDVIEFDEHNWFHINQKTTKRYHNLSQIKAQGLDAQSVISLAQGAAFYLPQTIELLERHPFGSQAWIPFNQTEFIIVVAPNGADDKPMEQEIKVFLASSKQGVNYHVGTWHHPLLSLNRPGEFIIIDRIGHEANCDEVKLASKITIIR